MFDKQKCYKWNNIELSVYEMNQIELYTEIYIHTFKHTLPNIKIWLGQ